MSYAQHTASASEQKQPAGRRNSARSRPGTSWCAQCGEAVALLQEELRKENEVLRQQFSSMRSENDELRKQVELLRKEKESLLRVKDKPDEQLREKAQESERMRRDLHPGKCARPECTQATADLEVLKKKIKGMEKKHCNSETCKNQELKHIGDTVGPKIRHGDRVYSHSEALSLLLQRAGMLHQQNQHLQEQLNMQSLSAAGRCQRSAADCQRIQEQLKRMQSEHRPAAKDLKIMSGGEYDQPLEEYNEVFTGTNPDQLLGVLESCLEQFEANKVLCEIFQYAYRLCKEAALNRITAALEDLFIVSEDKSRKAALGDISRAYGLLLHVSGLRSDETTCRDICHKIVTELTSSKAEVYNKVGRALQDKQEYLLKGVQVAWKFVTLPSPIIACQPEKYNPQITRREFGYWDEKTPDATLIYTRPVVYRCYDGKLADRGMVANTDVKKERGFIGKTFDYIRESVLS